MRFKPSLLGLSFVALALLAASACSDQAEGDRCAPENNDTDCASGLICKRLSELGVTGDARKTGVCCPPPNGSPPTSPYCLGQNSQIPGDAGPRSTVDTGVGVPTPDASSGGRASVLEASVPTDATPAAHD